jgi:predicted kinase
MGDMAREIILVNGVPGSGKTTLADQLADDLGVPSLSKDRVKEGLADAVSHPAVEHVIGAVAMEAVWLLAACVPDRVVVDSWWFRPRDLDHARKGLASAGAEASVEIWCDVSLALAQQRYGDRRRHEVHHDSRDMTAEWSAWGAQGVPLGIGSVICVDTSLPVDVRTLSHRVAGEFTIQIEALAASRS